MEDESNSNQNMDNIYDYDTEAEDTLSLCDYSINTIAAEEEDQEDCSRQLPSSSSTSSSSSDQEQYFEFCSAEWSTTTTTSYPPESIIFCGKIIPYGEQPTSQNDFQNLVTIKRTGFKKPVESFRWNGSHNISSSRKEEQKLQKISSVDKISVLNSLGKFRWSLFLFGGTRFVPTEMALRDIKSRQRRRSPSSTMFGLESDHDKKMRSTIMSTIGRKNTSPHGLLGLLKAIGCGGQHHANNLVKASIGCIPRL